MNGKNLYQLKFIYDVILGMRYEIVPMEYSIIDVHGILGRVQQTRNDMRDNMRVNNGKNK